ncbi:MAG: GH116 family glycosyl hydrolase [Candidatus Aminicenantes bacterium]
MGGTAGYHFGAFQEGLIPKFPLAENELCLHRLAKPGTAFIKAGRRFAILGDESGSFEGWAYPLKLFRSFTFSFFLEDSTRPIHGKDIVRYIDVTPEATILTYTDQSFTVKAIYVTPIEKPGCFILLDVDTTEPLTIVCGFLPVLQPMWPAGLGGQYARWDNSVKAYIISEPTGKNHGIIGSPAASGLSYTPAHMLSDAQYEFNIEVPNPQAVNDRFIPIYCAGGEGKREDIIAVYKKLQDTAEKFYIDNLDHYRILKESTLTIKTPDPNLDLALEWAKVVYDSLLVDNPDLGRGLIAGLGPSGTSGRPGFGWFFGGDAYINSFSILGYGGFDCTRETLLFTQKWQRPDGKMAHELSQAAAYIDWWKDYPYGYIHGDTTPYYIAAMDEYVKKTGDVKFITESWDSLEKAYKWCLSTDANEDGLMDNKEAGLGALEYGALTGIATDIYLAAVWLKATQAMRHLATTLGKKSLSEQAAAHFKKAKKAFETKFWDEENQFYTYAFNAEGQQVKEISPWNAVGLFWNFGTPQKSALSLRKLCSSELATDWGIRSISNKSRHFGPLNYNYGAVWPFITSWVNAALFAHHMPLQGMSLLKATSAHTFSRSLGCITEVISGSLNTSPQESVAHQGFSSAGVVLPLINGLLGLDGDALEKKLAFAPQFPADWENVSIKNYIIGQASFSFDVQKNKESLTVHVRAKNAEDYKLKFAPSLAVGTHVRSVTLDGQPIPFETETFSQVTQVLSLIPVKSKSHAIAVNFTPTVEILPVVTQSREGDPNKGLKIIHVTKEDTKLHIHVEGMAGQTYTMSLRNEEFVGDVRGATLKENELLITIPRSKNGGFVNHQITLHLFSDRTKS